MSTLMEIIKGSKVKRLVVTFLAISLVISPVMIKNPKAETKLKQTKVFVDNTPYLIGNRNVVKRLDGIPIENRKIVKKAFQTKKVLDRIRAENFEKQYRLFKIEKGLVNLTSSLDRILTLEAKLLKRAAFGSYVGLKDLAKDATKEIILSTVKQIVTKPKRSSRRFVSGYYH
jgi:hypothetical protein|tara:strand:+ start:116 stop:631 length:516 start_codon:yes stop_codon:yes gene_type:complete